MATVEFNPLYEHVLIEPVELKKTSSLIIPDTVKGHPTHGNVVAVGPGYRDPEIAGISPLTVKLGDLVTFRKGDGLELPLGGKNYIIMKETQILGILTSKGK